MHCLNYTKEIEIAVLVAPENFTSLIKENPIYTAFLNIEKIKQVPRDKFYPEPSVNSTLIKITRKPSYGEEKDDDAFIRRELYLQEDKKLKNGLKEALIRLYKAKHQEQLTQREAREIIKSLSVTKGQLEERIDNIPIDLYTKIGKEIEKRDV